MAKKKFIELTLGNYKVHHGYGQDNKLQSEVVKVNEPVKKLVAADKIIVVDEQYITTSHINDRLIEWEYSEGYDYVKHELKKKAVRPY